MAATLPQAGSEVQQAQAGEVRARSARTERAGALAPRPVTRGESSEQRAKVDWLNATFPQPRLSVEGFVGLLGRMFGRPVSAVQAGGLFGFEASVRLYAHHGAIKSHVGALAWGGEGQGGRWLFQLTGTGCGFVPSWADVADLLEGLGAKLTRLDLAVDFLEGQYTVDDAVSVYEVGGFSGGGRSPKSRVDGDWFGGVDGRSFYVGKAENGKMLRVYEKGKQLGDPASEWVRFEVQLGSRDRVIPLEALTERDAYFAGCYPALQEFVEAASEVIPTLRTAGEVTLAHQLHHLRRSYGKCIDVAACTFASEIAELVQAVRVYGLPRRLNPSSLAAGVTWADVHARIKELQ